MVNPSTSSATRAGIRRDAPIVQAQNLTKIFKDFWLRSRARAVDGIDLQINHGEIFGLLGPNGSGKSTTIKMILGLLRKSSGRLAVFGRPPSDVAVKSRIGYLPEESYLYPFLNARETLEYYGKLFQLDHRLRTRRIDELLDMVGLAGVQNRQVREYSKGMQRRIGIAQALINDPEFLILDEPTTGLDPIGTRQIKDLIIALGRRGKTILLSSHLLGDVEDCVSRMVILYGGKIRAEGTCDQLLTAHDRSIIETDLLDDQTIQEIEAVLQRHQRAISSVDKPRQRLEDLFVDIVERAQAERTATSGAQHGGQTAAFLLGMENATAEGQDLVDRLTARAAAAEAPASERAMDVERRPAGPDTSVIGDLVNTDQQPAPAQKSAPPQEAAKADEDVIRSLLGGGSGGDSGGESGGDSGGGSGGGRS